MCETTDQELSEQLARTELFRYQDRTFLGEMPIEQMGFGSYAENTLRKIGVKTTTDLYEVIADGGWFWQIDALAFAANRPIVLDETFSIEGIKREIENELKIKTRGIAELLDFFINAVQLY